MPRWLMIGFPMLALMTGIGLSPWAMAAVRGSIDSPAGQRLEGTWLVTVSRNAAPPGQPLTFPSTLTFLPDGAYFGTQSFTGGLTTPAHGQWVRTGDRQFTATFIHYRTDASGAYLGEQRVTSRFQLSPDFTELRGTSRIDVFDLSGTLIGSGQATAVGRRLEIGEAPAGP